MTAKNSKSSARAGPLFHPAQQAQEVPEECPQDAAQRGGDRGLAASIAVKGMLQNLVVEPERDADGGATGYYFVTIGEGRRLAQLLRVKRKEIKKTEPIRCVLDTENDPHEISLDENVIRENMHPADQFEAFKQLAEERGLWRGGNRRPVWRDAACGAAAPALGRGLPQADAGLPRRRSDAGPVDGLRHRRGPCPAGAVFESLSYNRDASTIRRMLTETHVAATDRRAIFVGAEVYGSGRHDPARPVHRGSRRLF